jgi:small subunit ribosomal protein S15
MNSLKPYKKMFSPLLNKSKWKFQENPGSTQSQILVLSKRVLELTQHLKDHPRDYAATRGLKKILGHRKRLLSYLAKQNSSQQSQLLSFLKQINSFV